jgi:hypothetical protein
MKIPDMSRHTLAKLLGLAGLFAFFFTMLGIACGEHVGFTKGYKAAYEHYIKGEIDCVVKVKHPEWLEQSK